MHPRAAGRAPCGFTGEKRVTVLCALQPEDCQFLLSNVWGSLHNHREEPPSLRAQPAVPRTCCGGTERAKGPWTWSTVELLQPEACDDGGVALYLGPQGTTVLILCRAGQGFHSAVSVTRPSPSVVGRMFQTSLSVETSEVVGGCAHRSVCPMSRLSCREVPPCRCSPEALKPLSR